MKIQTKFDIGHDVQLATDVEKRKRRVVKIIIAGNNYTEYLVSFGLEQSSHAECEIEIFEEKPRAGFAQVNNLKTPGDT